MLYCTACKQYAQQDGSISYREGDICPNCRQSRLIEKQEASANGLMVNGSGNAIDMHKTEQNITNDHRVDSHNDNSLHYDQRGMIQAGTYNAAQKSDREVDLLNISKGRQLYTEACEKFIGDDGVIDNYEERELSKIQTEYGLSAEWCKQEKERVHILLRNNNSLSKSARYDLEDLVYAIKDNDIDKAIAYARRLSSLIKEKDHEELQYYYHMAIAILQPKECLSMFEKTTNHNYWHTFWSYLAYLKENNIDKAREVHNSLDSYRNYPEDNDMLIRTAGECILGDKAAERDFSRIDSDYSPILEDLYKSMTLLVRPDIAKREGLVEKDYLFYIKHIFNCETTEEREKREREKQKAREAEERRLKAEAEAKRKAEERARIKAEQEAQRKREEEERKRKEAEERRKAEEERKRKEAEAKRKAEERARIKAEQEAQRKREEEERKRKEAEERRKAEEERLRKEAEAKRKREEEARRRAAEIEAKRKAEEEARRKAAEEARRKEEEERKRKEAEAKRRREEEYRKRMEEARAKAELEAKRRAEDKSTITVSKTSLTFSADGGSETVEINASGFWQLSAVPDNWAIVEEHTNSIVIKVLKNEAEKVRTDYLKLKCGYKEVRVDIKQEANDRQREIKARIAEDAKRKAEEDAKQQRIKDAENAQYNRLMALKNKFYSLGAITKKDLEDVFSKDLSPKTTVKVSTGFLKSIKVTCSFRKCPLTRKEWYSYKIGSGIESVLFHAQTDSWDPKSLDPKAIKQKDVDEIEKKVNHFSELCSNGTINDPITLTETSFYSYGQFDDITKVKGKLWGLPFKEMVPVLKNAGISSYAYHDLSFKELAKPAVSGDYTYIDSYKLIGLKTIPIEEPVCFDSNIYLVLWNVWVS